MLEAEKKQQREDQNLALTPPSLKQTVRIKKPQKEWKVLFFTSLISSYFLSNFWSPRDRSRYLKRWWINKQFYSCDTTLFRPCKGEFNPFLLPLIFSLLIKENMKQKGGFLLPSRWEPRRHCHHWKHQKQAIVHPAINTLNLGHFTMHRNPKICERTRILWIL